MMNPMSMSQRARRLLKEWGILLLLLIALHAFFFIGFVLIDPKPTRSLTPLWVLTGLYLVGLTAILIWFYRRTQKVDILPEYRFTLEHGLPTTAKVLKIAPTRWKIDRYRRLDFRAVPRHREYAMQVRVAGLNGSAYEVPLNAFLSGNQVPEKGDTILVKVHPDHPEVVVWGEKTLV